MHTCALDDAKAVCRQRRQRLGGSVAKCAELRADRIGVHVHVADGHAVAQEQPVACVHAAAFTTHQQIGARECLCSIRAWQQGRQYLIGEMSHCQAMHRAN